MFIDVIHSRKIKCLLKCDSFYEEKNELKVLYLREHTFNIFFLILNS